MTKHLAWLTFGVCRLLPHLALTAEVWGSRKDFLPPYAFALAFSGLICLNCVNANMLSAMRAL